MADVETELTRLVAQPEQIGRDYLIKRELSAASYERFSARLAEQSAALAAQREQAASECRGGS